MNLDKGADNDGNDGGEDKFGMNMRGHLVGNVVYKKKM